MQRYQDERTNLGELKGHIVKKIGVERSKRYFYYLSRFLTQKLTKSEFDKTCFKLLGRENLSLHNQLIRSILRNATVSMSPPVSNQNDPVWSNGGMRKSKMRDDSPVGSNGNVLQQPVCREENGCSSNSVGMEKGDLRGFNHQRYDEREGEFLRPVAKPRIPSKDQVAAVRDNDDENQEEQARVVNLSASPLVAPIGIQFCSASGSRRMVPVSTGMSCNNSGGLPDTELLRKRMENIAVAQGLEGVSMECANTLNAMLDVYLKKLIKSCIDLVKQQQGQNKRTQDEHSVSLLDFRTAMELNPQQLGKDWPTLLERISIRSFQEQDLEVKL